MCENNQSTKHWYKYICSTNKQTNIEIQHKQIQNTKQIQHKQTKYNTNKQINIDWYKYKYIV